MQPSLTSQTGGLKPLISSEIIKILGCEIDPAAKIVTYKKLNDKTVSLSYYDLEQNIINMFGSQIEEIFKADSPDLRAIYDFIHECILYVAINCTQKLITKTRLILLAKIAIKTYPKLFSESISAMVEQCCLNCLMLLGSDLFVISEWIKSIIAWPMGLSRDDLQITLRVVEMLAVKVNLSSAEIVQEPITNAKEAEKRASGLREEYEAKKENLIRIVLKLKELVDKYSLAKHEKWVNNRIKDYIDDCPRNKFKSDVINRMRASDDSIMRRSTSSSLQESSTPTSSRNERIMTIKFKLREGMGIILGFDDKTAIYVNYYNTALVEVKFSELANQVAAIYATEKNGWDTERHKIYNFIVTAVLLIIADIGDEIPTCVKLNYCHTINKWIDSMRFEVYNAVEIKEAVKEIISIYSSENERLTPARTVSDFSSFQAFIASSHSQSSLPVTSGLKQHIATNNR